MSVRLLCITLLLASCDGFREQRPDALPQDDSNHKIDLGRFADGSPPRKDSAGGKQPAGGCCGKNEDCQSARCSALNGGPDFCSDSCTTSPDSCPVGYFCDPTLKGCAPAQDGYQCGPQVVQATTQPFGGCCGKNSDCASDRCSVVGNGVPYCTEACTTSPDTCPLLYTCGASGSCFSAGDSTCRFF